MNATDGQNAGGDAFNPSEEFVRARFHGGRFAAHAIPFDFLDDLSAYRDLIIEVAKRLFLSRNPGRVRVPKGFVESFALGLVGVVPGNSSTAVAERLPVEYPDPKQPRLSMQEFSTFDEARDLVGLALRNAAANEPLPEIFTSELTKKFNSLGRALRDGETIDFSSPGSTTVSSLTKEVRKRIILSAGSLYEGLVDIKLKVTGGDTKSGRIFSYSDDLGRSFELKEHAEGSVLRALAHVHQVVRVCGLGLFDSNDNLHQITEHAELLYPGAEPSESVTEQMLRIRETPAGWYQQDTPAPSRDLAVIFEALIEDLVTGFQFAAPFIYPLPSGGISAEWSDGDWSISATLEPGTDIRFHALNLDSDRELEASVSIASENAAEEAVSFFATVYRSDQTNAD